jgi:hypothetical protein
LNLGANSKFDTLHQQRKIQMLLLLIQTDEPLTTHILRMVDFHLSTSTRVCSHAASLSGLCLERCGKGAAKAQVRVFFGGAEGGGGLLSRREERRDVRKEEVV